MVSCSGEVKACDVVNEVTDEKMIERKLSSTSNVELMFGHESYLTLSFFTIFSRLDAKDQS